MNERDKIGEELDKFIGNRHYSTEHIIDFIIADRKRVLGEIKLQLDNIKNLPSVRITESLEIIKKYGGEYMNEIINPYCYPEKLGLDLLCFDEPGMSYEYNTLCFWRTKEGNIYTSADSGCSCPVPFEDDSVADLKEFEQRIERVGSLEQALQIFDSWNRNYDNRPYLGIDSRKELQDWFVSRNTDVEG